MPKGAVEDPPLAIPALPHDRHHHVLGPVGMLARERRCGQDLVRRIDVHVVLLGMVIEVPDPLHDWIVRSGDVHAVVDDVTGMSDPLAAAHELVLDGLAESVAHTTVVAGKTDTATDGRREITQLL